MKTKLLALVVVIVLVLVGSQLLSSKLEDDSDTSSETSTDVDDNNDTTTEDETIESEESEKETTENNTEDNTTEDTENSETETPSENPSESDSSNGGNDNGNVEDEPVEEEPTYTFIELNKTMWVKTAVNVRDLPNASGTKLGKLAVDTEVIVTGQCKETKWYRIEYKGGVGYVSNTYLTNEAPKVEEDTEEDNTEGGGNSEDDKPIQYDPADTNKDGVVDADESRKYITPEKQACIDAGYGVVCSFDNGTWYAMLMESDEHKIDGKTGLFYLGEWLAERNLEAKSTAGYWIDSTKGWYWYVAMDIREFPRCPYCNGKIEEDFILCPHCYAWL